MSKGSKNDGSDNEEDEDEVAMVGAFVAEGNDDEVDYPSVRDIIYPKSPNLLSHSRTCELVFRKGNANEISCPIWVEDRTGFERELRRFRL
jgi:hypothetical protein